MSSYSETKHEKLEKRRAIVNKIMFIPIILLLALVPLIVRMAEVQPKDARMNMIFQKVHLSEYYSQYKSTAIIVLAILMVIFLYLFIEKTEIKMNKLVKVYLISAGVLALMTILSTVFADYKEIAIWGVYDRAEGMVMWLCYLLMMFYTFYIVKSEKSYIWIIAPLVFLVIATAILGAFQYAGHDLLTTTDVGLKLIIPDEYSEQRQYITSQFPSHKVLGTMYHYNYVGSFGAMIVPFFGVLTLLVRGPKKKLALGLVTVASLFILLGSTARSGLVGVSIAVVVGLIVFGRKLVMQWKKVLAVVLALVVILVGFNFATKGSIFSRIPTLTQDIVKLFTGTNSDFDYKDHIPVREVINEDGKAIFVLQNNQFIIEFKEDTLHFSDENGHAVEYAKTIQYVDNKLQENYTMTDERFANITILRQDTGVFTEQQPIDAILVRITGYGEGNFIFKLDESGLQRIDDFTGLPFEAVEAESIGFNGKEKLGSARGYIWSRSLPVFLKENLVLGSGPDTFVAHFPQGDHLAKWWAYEQTHVLVDKAHNLYLQIGMNQGGIALLAFLVMLGAYLIHSFRLYAFKGYYNLTDAMGLGIMLAVVGYLGAGIFNDSIISVAPIFWILLGAGMAVNYIKDKANELI